METLTGVMSDQKYFQTLLGRYPIMQDMSDNSRSTPYRNVKMKHSQMQIMMMDQDAT